MKKPKKKTHRVARSSSLFDVSENQKAQLLALFVTGAPVIAGIADKRADVAAVRARTELAQAETARNLSALALFSWGPRDAEHGK